jgi:hypothetical protein
VPIIAVSVWSAEPIVFKLSADYANCEDWRPAPAADTPLVHRAGPVAFSAARPVSTGYDLNKIIRVIRVIRGSKKGISRHSVDKNGVQ